MPKANGVLHVKRISKKAIMTPANAIALFALPMKATGVPITLVERVNYVMSAKRGAPPPLWEKASTQTNRACAV